MTSGYDFLFDVIQLGTRSLRSPDKVIFWSMAKQLCRIQTKMYRFILFMVIFPYHLYIVVWIQHFYSPPLIHLLSETIFLYCFFFFFFFYLYINLFEPHYLFVFNYSICIQCIPFYFYINPCPAEYIKMPHPILIFSQSDYLIQVVGINSPT